MILVYLVADISLAAASLATGKVNVIDEMGNDRDRDQQSAWSIALAHTSRRYASWLPKAITAVILFWSGLTALPM